MYPFSEKTGTHLMWPLMQRLDPEPLPFMEVEPHSRESPSVMVEDHICHPYTCIRLKHCCILAKRATQK